MATSTINTCIAGDQATLSFAEDQLKAIAERVERYEGEAMTISGDTKKIYGDAKGNGYDVNALRTIIRMRKQDANERAEQGRFSICEREEYAQTSKS
jgi:uncharacterized protein (UPF0335 family)